jgi:hypothetical protein
MKKKKRVKKKKEEPSLIYGAYFNFLREMRYYGEVQTGYRFIASSWLLASFAAMGFLLSRDDILPFPHILAVPIVCALGILGLHLLWYQDTFVNENYLGLNLDEAVKSENKYSWLPQLTHHFLILYKGNLKVLFYIGSKSILYLIMGISLATYFSKINLIFTAASIVGCIVLAVISSIFMIRRSGKHLVLMEYIKNVHRRS